MASKPSRGSRRSADADGREDADLPRTVERCRRRPSEARAQTAAWRYLGRMTRPSAAAVIRQALKRAFLPRHVARWMRRRREPGLPTVAANAQLQLYSRMLPGDFLHYGYFDDPETPAEAVSFADLHQAQLRYARLLVDMVGRRRVPVLDAGSGMGGMLGLLREAGHDPTGLTPDRFQVDHIRRVHPGVPVLHCRFEDLPIAERRGRFGAIVHSESLQYMDPSRTLVVVEEALAPGGRWIVADYFRVADGGERSGWRAEAFRERVAAAGFRIASERDVTPHVVPTLRFAQMLGERLGLPLLDFARDKLRAKNPVVHYVLEDAAAQVRHAAADALAVLDPEEFAARKRYLLLEMRRRD